MKNIELFLFCFSSKIILADLSICPQGCTPVLTKAWHADSILSVSNKNDKDACRCVRFFDEKLLGGLQSINSVMIIFCFGFHWVQCGGDLQAFILPPGSSKKIYVNVFFVYLPDYKIMTQFYQPSKIYNFLKCWWEVNKNNLAQQKHSVVQIFLFRWKIKYKIIFYKIFHFLRPDDNWSKKFRICIYLQNKESAEIITCTLCTMFIYFYWNDSKSWSQLIQKLHFYIVYNTTVSKPRLVMPNTLN